MADRIHRTANLFARMWRDYLRPYSGRILLALLFLVIEGSTLGMLSWMLKPLFDRVFVGGDTDAIWWVGGAIFALFLIRATTFVINRSLMTSVSLAVSTSMQTDLLRHIMTLDGGFFQQNPPGALIERVQGDSIAVQGVWSTFIAGAGRDMVSLVSLFGVALAVDPWWTMAALVGAPLLILPTLLVQRYIRRKMRQNRVNASQRATRLDEVLHGINAVKLNRMEDYQAGRFAQIVARIRQAEVKMSGIGATVPALVDVVTGLGFIGVLALGGAEVTRGERTVGDFMSFFTAMALAFQPLRRLGALTGTWQIAAASLERIYAVLDMRPAITSGLRREPPPDTTIRFRDVRLAYDNHPVLNGLTFTAEAGRTTALVGPSGAGKSTVFNLLTRLVDPESGQITLGGVPLREFDLGVLRDQFSTVSQDAALFDETLRENILLGGAQDDEALRRAVVAAHVADFTDGLPLGLDTPAGPRGSALSGGQRQRVAIARAVLRNAPILLLDEATSALDAQSERVVQQALDELSAGRTTLVIAHRLSTVRQADKIVVVEAGRVVEEGSHDQLMARGGAYAALVRLQFGED
ncbi:ABC transporter ATP-binding protein [Paracoccus sp. P2]|uniref:ATP-binding cassette domain-containing protein n=1 Tax=Paracoccus pantotrophus TaxID=82367 RepID=A0A7H9C0B2_PARPN|nr:ABC transporter transmembrane domain-containing protein [Paracoccus pantotrophus]MDF3853487.1 ABC transporter transmembrane domain-containing protein [Paracoccus pantotrophus]QLH15551.1 ATP-binding cassette domain-containing protein [Paracoccus pantotrophus]RDD93596.1 ATP-binding cassette domain-containing protein [Paracoccus pantotrophus]RNI20072.1 ATP-binding cassette domain-containing protein [Paracoccus pantotrophus]WGR65694.1 ATP-binding cassette domain-containing protein [Paracoccus p